MQLAAICFLATTLAVGLSACDGSRHHTKPDSAMNTNQPPSPRHTNRLAGEKSPYLLQHAHNPVDWFAWGDEAFARAQAENKPIFLSIGYSTCHWCHVMERESFEDEKIGGYLREHFISIKLDREERPDVDKIYMTFVQSTTGGGGWPLNVFLTPDRKPFFGGTYFPPDDRHGRGSFLTTLQKIAEVWQERHGEVAASANAIRDRLKLATAPVVAAGPSPSADTLRRAGAVFMEAYDPRNGGFGGAPKFPQPSQPALLLRYARRFQDPAATRMTLHTCDRMAAGGIHDQLGGGFARYSVDAEWRVPHFEKMLYDNAQLLHLYLDAYLVSGEPRVADRARDIIGYLRRDMTHPEGGFYSAEDADSDGHEGKFYCWTHEELSGLLTPEEFNVTAGYFGITKPGNFVDHSHPSPLAGQNVLHIADPDLRPVDQPLLASAKQKMLKARNHRSRPQLDDKILASWNGLMLGAMARAFAVLGDESYLTVAEKNLAFIQARLWDAKSRTLYHRWRDGARDNVQLLEAYAFQLEGVLQLYEATLEPKHLDFASALAETMLAKFYDTEHGGFWQSAADSPDLILRVKDDYDGAEPSGNSVATLALLKLAAITDRADFRQAAETTLRLFGPRLEQHPQALPYLLHALDFSLDEPRRVVIAGDPGSVEARELIHAAHSVYQPNIIVLGNAGAVEEFARTLPAKNGPVAYLCTGRACQPPTKDAREIHRLLLGP